MKQASRLDFLMAFKSSSRLSSIPIKRRKSASMAGRTTAPSSQILSFHSSRTFCCSSDKLLFLRVKKFRTNFNSLSALLALVMKQASRLDFLMAFKSSSRLSSIPIKRRKSASLAGRAIAPSSQILSFHSSRTFCCSSDKLLFLRVKNFYQISIHCLRYSHWS